LKPPQRARGPESNAEGGDAEPQFHARGDLAGALPDLERTRTVALLGHRHAGKTSLGDQLLSVAGAVRAAGRVDDRTSLLDHQACDHRHGSTQFGGVAWLDWREHRVHLVDTPGSEGLFHEQLLAMSLVDAGIVVVSAVDGVEHGGARVLAEAERTGLPCLVVITRIDRPFDLPRLLAEIELHAGVRAVPIVPPPRATEDELTVLRDRLAESVALADDLLLARYLDDLTLDVATVREGLGAAVRSRKLVPVVFASGATGEGVREVLDAILDALPSPATRRTPVAVDSETGEDVVLPPGHAFVAQVIGSRLDPEGNAYHIVRVWSGVAPRKAWVHAETGQSVRITKLYALRGPRASMAKELGPGSLLATWDSLPGRVGDTYTDGHRLVLGAPPWPAPLLHARLLPQPPSGAARLDDALNVVAALDPALDIARCELTGVPLLGVIGQDHLERVLDVLRDHHRSSFAVGIPLVPYLEAPTQAIAGIEGVHRRATNDEVHEFGRCVVSLEPAGPDTTEFLTFASAEEQLPVKFHAAVADGVARAAMRGPLGKYPVTGFAVRVEDGEYDMFASTEEHLALAAQRAVEAALAQAGTLLLEPWWRIHVHVPADMIGALLAEIGVRRGRVGGLEVDGREAIVSADCPYRELRSFGPRLLALTAGRGRFTGRLVRYDVLPAAFVREAVATSPFG
jgi:elongation factor G